MFLNGRILKWSLHYVSFYLLFAIIEDQTCKETKNLPVVSFTQHSRNLHFPINFSLSLNFTLSLFLPHILSISLPPFPFYPHAINLFTLKNMYNAAVDLSALNNLQPPSLFFIFSKSLLSSFLLFFFCSLRFSHLKKFVFRK